MKFFFLLFFLTPIFSAKAEFAPNPFIPPEQTEKNVSQPEQQPQLPQDVETTPEETTYDQDIKTEAETKTSDVAPAKKTENILKYGDKIRLRFANIKNTTLHTQENKYTYQNTSGNQIISGYFDINNYQNYLADQYDDEWTVLGPYPLPEEYKKGEPVKSNDVVRFLNPKTHKKLHYFYTPQYKAPGSTFLLEVCGFDKNSPANNWQINIQNNTNEQNEIIYNKTLFTVESLNELNEKYLTIANATFSILNKNQQLIGLTQIPNNNWFIEFPNQKPQNTPKIEVAKVEEKEKEKKEEKKEKVEKLTNTMWAINNFDKVLFRNNISETSNIGDSWSYISTSGLDVKIINNIASGPQRSLWAIDNLNQLHFKQGNSAWIIIPNNSGTNISQFLDISVGTNIPTGQNISIWAIDADRKIYYRENVSTANLHGINWSNVEFTGKVKNEYPDQISVDEAGNVAVISTLGNIYYRQTTQQNPRGSRWLEITKIGFNPSEPIKQIKLGPNGSAWALNKNQKIYFINNIIGEAQIWQNIEDGYLSEIAVNMNGTVFGVNANGTLYKRANTQINPSGSGWIKIKDNVQKITAASNNFPICIDRAQYTFYNKKQGRFSQFIGSKISYQNLNNEWIQIPLTEIQPIELQEITVNSLGQLFALDRFYNSYYRKEISTENIKGNNWTKFDSLLPLTLELGQLENASTLWNTNIVNNPEPTKTNITQSNPLGTSQFSNPKRKTIQFEATQNLVCSLSFFENKYIVYFYNREQNKWLADKTAKELKQIAIQQSEKNQIIWAIDPKNKVFIKTNLNKENPQGDTWQEIIDKNMQQIFVSPNGTIWGLSTEQHYKYKQDCWLYYRTGISETVPHGTNWTPLNSAIEKLPNSSARFLKYGDKISLCTALNRLMPKNKAGEFIDTQNLLAFANGTTGKNSQILEIINPQNPTDNSLIKYNDPIIFKTNENKYLNIAIEIFLLTNIETAQNATQFFFGKISNNVKGNLIEYGTRVKIQTSGKSLVNDPSLLNSNLILKGDTTVNNGLFVVLKPINNKIPVEQGLIDKVETSATLFIQQINQNLQNVFKATAQPESQAKNGLAQILVTLFNNKTSIPASSLRTILQTVISPQKSQLLTQPQRDYISISMIGKIPDNFNSKFQPLLTTIINKFNESLRSINLSKEAILQFIQATFDSKNLMNQNEINGLRMLITNLYSNSAFLTPTEKNNLATMLNSLGRTVTKISTQTQPTQMIAPQPVAPQPVAPQPITQRQQYPSRKQLTTEERNKITARRINLQQRKQKIVTPII